MVKYRMYSFQNISSFKMNRHILRQIFRKKKMLFGILIGIPIVWIFINHHNNSNSTNIKQCNPKDCMKFIEKRDYRRILLWTPFCKNEDWYLSRLGKFTNPNCKNSTCNITKDKRLLHESDAVLFHLNDLIFNSYPLPQTRHPDQIWVAYSAETPLSLPRRLTMFDHIFNWTASYRKESDVVNPYGKIIPLKGTENKMGMYDYSATKVKNKIAICAISNCYNKLRIETLNELKKFINMDFYGKCGDSKDPCRKNQSCFWDMVKSYKFFIAHENAFCNDYITEKFWRPLKHSVVPVVFGARKSDYIRAAPPNSFIYAGDFESIESLAKYLIYLDSNNTAYNEYFKWKLNYEVIGPDLFCHLCEQLYNNELLHKRKSISVSQFWSRETNCVLN